MKANIIPVILAGGSGTRLWPLSQPDTPKQFLRLFGEKTLLQNTVERIDGLDKAHLLVVTGEPLRVETEAQLRELGLGEERVTVLPEPCARNTAPAIALAAAWIRDRYGLDAVMAVLPADHHVGQTDKFCETLRLAATAAVDDRLVTLGIRPTGPETGYGYIEAGMGVHGLTRVQRFVEKPDIQRATEYLASGAYFWNSGMFVWQTGAILKAFSLYMRELAKLAELDCGAFVERFHEAPNQSIDYGILEQAQNVWVVPADFTWSDVGTWESVAAQWRSEGRTTSPAVELASESVDVYSTRQVAVIGVDNLLVVDGEEGLLIMKKGFGQEVGAAAKKIAALSGMHAATSPSIPRDVPKPWGKEHIWAETQAYVGKILEIKAGEALSLQYHRIKDETIHVLDGELCFRYGPSPESLQEIRMHPGDTFHIRTRTVHQMEAISDCRILEVSTPHLEDVVRLIDRYGRTQSIAIGSPRKQKKMPVRLPG